MNSVEIWAKNKGLEDCHHNQIMDMLQEHGQISDNCVHIEDIGNHKQAMMWLAKNFDSKQQNQIIK